MRRRGMRFGQGRVRPPLGLCVAYAALGVPLQMIWEPLLSTMPALYARYGAVPLSQIGAAMLALRLLDVALDPLIGLASDRTRSRLGRRKPWLIGGTLAVLPGCWALFAVPSGAGISFFAGAMALVYVGWSMIQIPHAAWLGDLTHDEGARGALAGWRTAAANVGALLFIAIPLLARFADTAMTPAVLGVARMLVLGLLPTALLVPLIALPDGRGIATARQPLRASLRALADSRAMRLLCLCILLESLASGMCAACYFFYLDTYLGIGGTFGTIGVATYLAAIPAGLFWPRLIGRIGPRAGLAIASGISAPTLALMAAIPHGRHAALLVIVLFTVTNIISTGDEVATPIIAAEAADAEARQQGSSDFGGFTAAAMLARKFGIALGGGAALMLLGWFGFDPNHANGATALAGFGLTLFVLPALLYLSAAASAWCIPVTGMR